jgi:ribonuclease-3
MGTLPKVLEQLPDPAEALEDGTGPDAPGGLSQLQEALSYRFDRPALLRVALTLGSWANEHPGSGWPSNAALEFFGDAVLDLVAADVLWQRFPDLAEGELTRLRASLVAEVALAEIAQAVELGRYLYLGRGDLKRGARDQPSTLADAVEAVLGAVFLDGRAAGHRPLESATAVFERLFADQLSRLQPEHGLDAKSRLQHWAQARYRITPTYIRIGDKPPPGDPRWQARVELRHPDGTVQVLGEGEGRSLKKAEQRAAAAALRNAGVD